MGSASSASRSRSRFPSADAARRPCASRRPAPGPLHVRVLADVRRRPQLHARHDHRQAGPTEAQPMKTLVARRLLLLRVDLALAVTSHRRAVAAARRAAAPASRRSSLEEFRLGLDDFLEVETSEEGLGPAFNGTSCAVCHNVPVVGGGGDHRRDSRRGPRCATAGPCRSRPTARRCSSCSPRRRTAARCSCPPEAVIIARRIPIPLFGAGLVEAIPDEAILALRRSRRSRWRRHQRPRRRSCATSRPAIARVGRFGWKAQHATLLAFGADAYRNEMGITNDLFREELGVGLTAGAVPALRSVSRSRRSRRSGDSAPRHRQLRVVHEVSRAGRPRRRRPAVARRASRCSRASAARRATRRTLTTGASREPAFDRQRGAALFGSAAARHRNGRRHSAGGGAARGDSHAGAVGPAVPPAAAARRQRPDHRGGDRAVMPARRRPTRRRFEALLDAAARRRCSRSCRSL